MSGCQEKNFSFLRSKLEGSRGLQCYDNKLIQIWTEMIDYLNCIFSKVFQDLIWQLFSVTSYIWTLSYFIDKVLETGLVWWEECTGGVWNSCYLTLRPLLRRHIVSDWDDGHHAPDKLLTWEKVNNERQLLMAEGGKLISTFRSHLSWSDIN